MDSKISPSFADSALAQTSVASPPKQEKEQVASQSVEAAKDIAFGSIAEIGRAHV